MEAFSALLTRYEGNPPVTGGFPPQRPVTRSFDVFFDVRPNGWANSRDAGDDMALIMTLSQWFRTETQRWSDIQRTQLHPLVNGYWALFPFPQVHLSFSSLNGETSYHQVSQNLEGARSGFRAVRTLWNLTSVCQISKRCVRSNYHFRSFESSKDITITRFIA